MLIRTPKPSEIKENQVTDENVYHNRRQILKSMGFLGASALMVSPHAKAVNWFGGDETKTFKTTPLEFSQPPMYHSDDALTPEQKIISHNNFYEFGSGKSDPLANSQSFKVKPWTLSIDGLVEKPLKKAQPLSAAKYVVFETLYDPKQMPGQRNRFTGGGIDYPYVEGLRLDEAMHPLTLMSVGLYGKTLPPQNGAPIRLVVPWKYGFKSIKSVVSIRLTDKKPKTTWEQLAASEYGFYANVNPQVDHPRWTQASERRITSGGLFNRNRIETQMFNGYPEVASMYAGMDLRKFY